MRKRLASIADNSLENDGESEHYSQRNCE